MNNFVKKLADYQYSLDSTFWIITSSKAKYTYFGHLQEEYEMMASVSINKVSEHTHTLYNKIIYIYIYIYTHI